MRYLWLFTAICLSANVQAQNGTKQITLDDLWKNHTFYPKDVPGFNAMNDGKNYTGLDNDDKKQVINVYDLATGDKGRTIYSGESVNGDKIESYVFSKDEQKLLFLTNSESVYRHSTLYKVYVYDIATGRSQLLDNAKVLHPSFSPDGSKVAFVKDDNLYYKDLNNGQTIAVSKDGRKNAIRNGNCDWVYEEEFAFTQAYNWSPDGSHIAYYRFDESKVPEYTLTIYDNLYPKQETYRYPKAGENNSIVQIKLYDLATRQTVLADAGQETNQYIPRIKWTKNANQLCVYRLNRRQNKLELSLVNANDGTSSVIYTEENKYFINITDNMKFIDEHTFVFTSERSGYNHVWIYDWQKGALKDLTKGNYDVDNVVAVDDNRKEVFYTAAEKSPMERKLYSVAFDGDHKTCLTQADGMHSITPCKGYNYFLDRYSSLTKVPVVRLINTDGDVVRTLEGNKALEEKLQDYSLGKIRFIQVNGVSEKLNAWMITPPDFDSTKKYPVLMFQYSGPGSQQVADRFPVADYFWHQMLAEKGYVVVCVDPTGTGFRGEEFRKKTYLQLGKYESDDQIAAAKYLGGLPYVDKGRIGIWGWSYGGFMSSTCIFKGADVFKMAIAVAPVTNWRYYDNIYTERYMRLPQENPKGYDDNAPEKMVSGLKGKFLLVHGTADDNVHFQNSMMLVDAMIKANKEYDSEFYPNKNHGIFGGNTRYHLYNRMTKFILDNL